MVRNTFCSTRRLISNFNSCSYQALTTLQKEIGVISEKGKNRTLSLGQQPRYLLHDTYQQHVAQIFVFRIDMLISKSDW